MDANGKHQFRIVIDFGALDEVTLNEFHPLRNITEILNRSGQCQLFSVIDLASGFYQIPKITRIRRVFYKSGSLAI